MSPRTRPQSPRLQSLAARSRGLGTRQNRLLPYFGRLGVREKTVRITPVGADVRGTLTGTIVLAKNGR